MPDTEARLIQCFQAVFADLSEIDAKRANINRIGSWDSVATVILAATVEEEFGVQFIPQEIAKLTSFERFLVRLDHL